VSKQSVYDLSSVDLPRASGGLLRLLVSVAESPLTRWLILPGLMKNAGIDALRAMRIDEAPTFLPLHPAPDDGVEAGTVADVAAQPDRPPGFQFRTVREYGDAYRSGATTPLEVAEKALAAIEASDAHDPPLRIFINVKPEDVLAQARAATERYRAGAPLGPFDGVPVAIKDEVDMVPYPTTVGTTFLGKSPATRDATVVARLREAGALLLGKTNMHEIGITPNSLNPHYGTVRNPYDPAHDAGGSSSGPAAAVAAGLCPVAVGADGGGSIRIPASFCGLIGLKATFGRVSEMGAFPLCWSVAHLGPLAATAEDAALSYAVMAGPDPAEPNSQHQPAVRLDGLGDGDLRGVKLGLYREWFTHADPDVVRLCEQAVGLLANAGAEIVEIEIAGLHAAYIAHGLTILAEMIAGQLPYDAEHRRDLGPVSRLPMAVIRPTRPADYLQAQRVRTQTIAAFNAALAQVDAIVTPTSAIPAPAIPEATLPYGESNLSEVIECMRFVNPANFTGHPAISVPVGTNPAGLPVGLHLMGRAWEEHQLLRMAYVLEGKCARQKPAVYYDLLGN